MYEDLKIDSELTPSDPRFGCGPSLIPVSFIESLLKTDKHLLGTSHRKPAIKNLVKEVQDGLRKYFNVPEDYSIVLGNGGATFLFDALALGVVEKKAAHFTCGEFSEKWYKSSKHVPWIEAEQISVDYGKGINGSDVSDADMICVTLNETSTGVQLSKLPEVHDDAILAVDATSGAGQVPCDVSKTDIFFFSPQKVFASDGGLWVAIMSKKARERALKIADNSERYVPYIMSWKLAINNSDKNQTYNTPSITTIYFLNEQVKLMNKLGHSKVIEMAQDKANLLYNWAEKKDYLSCYIEEGEFRSTSVATIDVDDKYNTGELIKMLETRKLAYGIDAYRKLGRNQLRISLFHNITIADIEKLTKIISLAFES